MTPLSSQTIQTQPDLALARYRTNLEVSQVTVDGHPRVLLCDPETEDGVRLGPIEYRVATLFDGHRTFEEIARVLREEDAIDCSPEKIAALAERLLGYGLLEIPGVPQADSQVSPFTGLDTGGRVHDFLVLKLFEIKGDGWLVRLLERAPFLATRAFLFLCVAAVAASIGLFAVEWDAFKRDVLALDPSTGRFWLLMVGLGSAANAIHELGHAIACRAQGVRVISMGWVLHYFLLGAWVRPSKAWRELGRAGRMACVLAGPLASALVSGAGVLLWFLSRPGLVAEIGVILALSSIIGTVITLVPVHTGDGYVILTDLLSMPDLRQRAMAYARMRIGRRKVTLPRTRRLLLGGFALSVVVWRAVLVSLVLYVLWLIPVTFGGVPVVGIVVLLLMLAMFRRQAVRRPWSG